MEIASDIRFSIDSNGDGDGCPPVNEFVCPACGVREGSADLAASVLFWEQGTRAFQISNAKWAHASCLEKLGAVEMIKGTDFVDSDGEDSLEE
jgi:hypothetical protein